MRAKSRDRYSLSCMNGSESWPMVPVLFASVVKLSSWFVYTLEDRAFFIPQALYGRRGSEGTGEH
jgi:hypothetical protein